MKKSLWIALVVIFSLGFGITLNAFAQSASSFQPATSLKTVEDNTKRGLTDKHHLRDKDKDQKDQDKEPTVTIEDGGVKKIDPSKK